MRYVNSSEQKAHQGSEVEKGGRKLRESGVEIEFVRSNTISKLIVLAVTKPYGWLFYDDYR